MSFLSIASTALFARALFLAAAFATAAGTSCNEAWSPKSAATDLPDIVKPAPPPGQGNFPSLFGVFVGVMTATRKTTAGKTVPLDWSLGTYETPIQFRLIQEANTIIYSTMSSYEDHALEHFGRVPVSTERRIGSCASAKHRDYALLYAFLYAAQGFFPDAVPVLKEAFSVTGADVNVCDLADENACLDLHTPWGTAHRAYQDALKFAAKDGWNADGSLSRGHNRRPYEDPRGVAAYHPTNLPGSSAHYRNWEPLLESNGRGYLTRQEHVTPHIGDMARSIFFQDSEICAKEVSRPSYHNPTVLLNEFELLLERMANLTAQEKMEIEFFDSKLTSLVPLLAQLHERMTGTGLDDWRFIVADTVTISALYESVILSWKEKVAHDFVRPPSLADVYAERRTATVTTWAGPNEGVKEIDIRDWEPYIRTMPHAEFPSGSSCACAAYEEALATLYGGYDFTAPPFVQILNQTGPPGLLAAFQNFSSVVEPGQPTAPIQLLFSSLTDIAERCGTSRLNGGMHFTDAVPAGRQLCHSVGKAVATKIMGMTQGTPPPFVVNPEEMPPVSFSRCW